MSNTPGVTEIEREYIAKVSNINNDAQKHQVLRLLDVLNGKSANLLQHVSIMIAIVSVFFVISNPDSQKENIFRFLLLGEITAYMIIALGCLRVAWVTGPNNLQGKSIDQFIDDVLILHRNRRRTYKICVRATWAITFIFIATIWLEYIIT